LTQPAEGQPGGPAAETAAFEIGFVAEPFAVRDALRSAVARFARQLSEEEAGTLELVLAEALNNIAEHAYVGTGARPIRLEIRRTPGALHCVIDDRGRPMPGLVLPTGRIEHVAAAAVDDLPEGGWGWALIRTLTSELSYRREGRRNRLRFSLPLADAPAQKAANMPK